MTSHHSLSQGEAKTLAEKVGFLSLPDVTEFGARAVQELTFHPGTLELGGFRSLPPSVANALSLHRGWLLLDSLETLDIHVAHRLAKHGGGLSLRGVRSLDVKVTRRLATTTSDLRLDKDRTVKGTSTSVGRLLIAF